MSEEKLKTVQVRKADYRVYSEWLASPRYREIIRAQNDRNLRGLKKS